MALKDWKKIIEKIKEYPKYIKKPYYSENKKTEEKIYISKLRGLAPWYVFSNEHSFPGRRFRSQKSALKYAKSYMKKH